MKKNLLFVLALVLSLPMFANANLLKDSNIKWGNRIRNGATGAVNINEEKTVSIKRTNDSGDIMFINENYLPIVAGKTYQLSVEMNGATDNQKLSVDIAACKDNGETIKAFSKGFTLKSGQPNILDVMFTAPANSTKVRFHIISKSSGEFTINNLNFGEYKAPTNLFRDSSIKWGNRVRNGAAGKVTLNADKSFNINRTNSNGEIMLLNENYLPLIPGKYYEVTAVVKAKNSATLTLMLQMPGAARRPFPTITETLEPNENSEISLKFLAADDENSIRIHLISNVAMDCQVYEIRLKEITKEEYKKKIIKKS